MNRERTQGLLAGLILLSSTGLVAPDAGAGSSSGQLGVGIVILDTCHVTIPPGSGLYRPAAGLGLKCSKGTSYTMHVAAPSATRLGMGAADRTTVTVDF